MTMDKEEQLEKDSVEQLLKYVPTVAERDLLNSHAHEMESFARPDRFLLEMSRCVLYTAYSSAWKVFDAHIKFSDFPKIWLCETAQWENKYGISNREN